MQSPEVQAKAQDTCVKNLGVPHPAQSPEILAKMQKTCIERLGCANPFQSPEVKLKSKATMLENYGVEHSSLSPEIQAKKIATCMEIYGFPCALQAPEVKEKTKATLMELYGVEHISHLSRVAVVAFILLGDITYVRGKYISIVEASKNSSMSPSIINQAIKRPEVRNAGLFSTELNSFVKKRINVKKLPTEEYPNLYRVHWMRLEEFIQKYPEVEIPEITI